jgi:A/G-specific adenine glycosylase
MAALPGSEWTEKGEVCPPNLGTVRHVFSHFSLDLAIVRHSEPVGEGWWQPIGRLADAGLPTLYRKAVAAVLARDERSAV